MKTTFFMTWENHASEVAQCMCHYHRHFEEIGRGGKSTLPKPLLIHRHPRTPTDIPRTSTYLVQGSTVQGKTWQRCCTHLHACNLQRTPAKHHAETSAWPTLCQGRQWELQNQWSGCPPE